MWDIFIFVYLIQESRVVINEMYWLSITRIVHLEYCLLVYNNFDTQHSLDCHMFSSVVNHPASCRTQNTEYNHLHMQSPMILSNLPVLRWDITNYTVTITQTLIRRKPPTAKHIMCCLYRVGLSGKEMAEVGLKAFRLYQEMTINIITLKVSLDSSMPLIWISPALLYHVAVVFRYWYGSVWCFVL